MNDKLCNKCGENQAQVQVVLKGLRGPSPFIDTAFLCLDCVRQNLSPLASLGINASSLFA